MELIRINESCYYFHGAVNIGYVHKGSKGMLIDAGIDKSTMKKVIRQLTTEDLPITHLFITHAHTDHFGGASYLQDQGQVVTIAPYLEEAIMRYPILEPTYLFTGNDPLPELRNKFLEGNPITIDHVIKEGHHQIDPFLFEAYYLPGHSYYQLAIKIDNILYAADSYFAEEQLHKHKIPFLTDAQLTINSLHLLKNISCDGAVPGHGPFEENFYDTVDKNIAYHQSLLKWLESRIIQEPSGITHETVVGAMCVHFGVQPKQLSQWILFRTAVTGYIVSLIKQDKIKSEIVGGIWRLYSK
ncbi:MBL fold metallo-hydrolase [Aquibacillus koreensis]|uniref:MBL fold metallo-hydrolase n=1 Tax=Aquibacillus koreensis TaxID=279446 RepID=A0A9X4AHT8_9BACI|nr:MBL fold metallo-hydrolase [Aquibacillus koreensis]MCT2535676.1 MBL fold metallo-hydrolase [Aquibacillus koreensis]MDC3420039.1 MBL fold metallo-hydrolase [Aquibacillus koreensis]